MDEVEAQGGMTAAVQSGGPKAEIEKAAALRQARVDRGEDVIVGVNRYRLDNETPIAVPRDRQCPVRDEQVARLAEIRRTRDAAARGRSARALRAAARTDGNLLAASHRRRPRPRHAGRDFRGARGRLRPPPRRRPASSPASMPTAIRGDPQYAEMQARLAAFAAARRPPALDLHRQDGAGRA